ncbi:MAG: HNH endonuclease [Clostridia bacterium]|nr:HNH endonuclease [Clostridia bacterium]
MDIEYKKYKDTHLVYNDGRVYSLISNKFLKFDYSNSGYARLKLNGKSVRVHRLVMELFKGPSDLSVDHINGNKHDNRLCNLQYVTAEENARLYWERNKLAKLIDNKNKLLIKLNKINKEISEEVLKK